MISPAIALGSAPTFRMEGGGLTWAITSLVTPHGQVEVAWRLENASLVVDTVVPWAPPAPRSRQTLVDWATYAGTRQPVPSTRGDPDRLFASWPVTNPCAVHGGMTRRK